MLVPRKTRRVQKLPSPSRTRPKPSATPPSSAWHSHSPEATDELEAVSTGQFPDGTAIWMHDEAFEVGMDTPLDEEEGAARLWTSTPHGEAYEGAESVHGHDDLVRRYLSEMGAFERLTPAEEVALAKQIEQGQRRGGRKVSNRKAPQGTRHLTGAEKTLWTDQLDPDEARAYMIRANLRLVVSIAKRFYRARSSAPGSHSGGQPRAHESGGPV